MTDFSEQRSCIKLCYELGKSATETLGVLRSIYGNNALCRSKTFHWYSRFRDGQIPGGKPDVSQDFPPSSSSSTAKQSGKRGNKRRKTMENPQIPNNFDVTVIEAQLNYVKMLMKLGKTPSETYTCMQALFGPNAISRIDLLQLYFKLETDQNLSGNILPPIIKPPRKQRASFPAHTKGGTAVQPPVEAPAKRQTQSRVDLMTGGSFWHAPFNDEKENTSLTENQVCFMDHFMLSGDSNQSNSYKITLPKNGDRYQDSYNSGVSMPNLVDGNLPLPLPVETLNRMHVMDGDCSKADIVAEKAPELQLPSPAAEAAVAANGHDAADHEGDHQDQDVVKQGLKGVVMKEQPKEAEAAVKQDEKDAMKRNGDVSDVIDGENRPIVVNGSDALVTSDKDDSETKTNLVNGDSKVVDVEKIDENMVVDEAEDGPKVENGVEDVPMQDAKEDESVVKDESAVKEEEEEEEEEEVEKKNDNQEEEEEAPSVASSRKDETVKDEGVAVVSEDEERTSVTSSQNRKRRLPDTNGDAENCDNEAEGEGEMEGDAEVEGEGEGEGEGSSSDSESGTKRQRVEVEGEDERERLVREYVERCTQSVEEMSRNADKLQREIGALGELARAKELEWNSILRLRKLKEEMLERLLRRRRQTMMLADNGLSHDWANDFTKSKANKNNSNNHLMMVPIVSSSPGNMTSSLQTGAINRAILSPDTTRLARLQRPILPKPTAAANHSSLIDQQNTVIGEGRQGPILDVKSIIADYRSRHPADNVPRRGRRMKMAAAGAGAAAGLVSSTRITGSPALMSMANMALCSGAHIRNNSQDCNTGQENSRPSSTDSTRSMSMHSETTTTTTLPAPGLNFKDVLVQFAKMSQPPAAAVTSLVPSALKQPHPPPPPPYPEVTLHPVPAPTSHSSPSPPTSSHSSSLLHGILTKSSAASVSSGGASSTTTSHRPTTFSPTLARLLTAPERERTAPSVTATSVAASHFRPPVSRVSISDLLTTSKKTRNEITITPVSSHSSHPKSKDGVVLLEDDPEETDSTDRLVIDESGGVDQKDEQGGGGGDEAVPECQGCNQRAAQFVCAGCGNQWYCSRECQVTAWEEHSEMCSG